MGSKELGWCWGPDALPYPGMPCFLLQWSGEIEVIAWPMRAVSERGGAITNVTEFLDGMSPSDTTHFMKEAPAVYFPLKKGETAWIPGGYFLTTVCTKGMAMTLVQPWFASFAFKGLAKDVWKGIIDWNLSHLEEEMKEESQASAVLSAMAWFKANEP